MLTRSTSDVQELTDLALQNPNNPAIATAAYENYVQMMRDLANNIGDAELRSEALALTDLDATIIDLWSNTVANPAEPGTDEHQTRASERAFMQAYQEYNELHGRTVDELLTACPREF